MNLTVGGDTQSQRTGEVEIKEERRREGGQDDVQSREPH